MVGGFAGLHRSAMETTLVVRRAHSDSGLHGEGEKARCAAAVTSFILSCSSSAVMGRLQEASVAAFAILVRGLGSCLSLRVRCALYHLGRCVKMVS
jgi:hypothetical protein